MGSHVGTPCDSTNAGQTAGIQCPHASPQTRAGSARGTHTLSVSGLAQTPSLDFLQEAHATLRTRLENAPRKVPCLPRSPRHPQGLHYPEPGGISPTIPHQPHCTQPAAKPPASARPTAGPLSSEGGPHAGPGHLVPRDHIGQYAPRTRTRAHACSPSPCLQQICLCLQNPTVPPMLVSPPLF